MKRHLSVNKIKILLTREEAKTPLSRISGVFTALASYQGTHLFRYSICVSCMFS